MNRIFLIAFILISSTSFSQKSLRDSLFSGKLKPDSALVAKSKGVKDSTTNSETGTTSISSTNANDTAKLADPSKPVLKFSDNMRTWKKFTDEYVKTINAELSDSKKVKKGSYTVTLDYEIGTDGVVGMKSLLCDPKSETLIELINEKMMTNAPQLAPQIVNGAPKKSSKRSILIFTKEKN
jgi:hypothetical protein